MIDRALEVLRQRPGFKGTADSFTCRCPGHNDQQNSLQVKVMNNGKVSVTCYAGCEINDILAPLDLKPGDLYPDDQHNTEKEYRDKAGKKPKQFDCAYDYVDATGTLIYQVVRWKEPKGFSQRRPDQNKSNGWAWDLSGVDRVLYRLPDVLAAKETGRTVYLCEGEKDADNLRERFNVCATTSAGGVAKWLPSDAATLAGADVVIIPDNDKAGISGAWKRHDSIPGSVIVLLPGLQDKGDVSDWLAAGGTLEQLTALVAKARENPPERPWKDASADGVADPLTELANAHRLAKKHGGDLRHHTAMGWLCWDGRRFRRAEKMAKRKAHTVGSIIRKEAAAIRDEELAKQYRTAARRAESAAGIEATLKIAASLEGIDANDTVFDADPWLLNCANGTVDLRTGERRPHAREDNITRIVPHNYNPAARCKRWTSFLAEVFRDDAKLIAYVQWALGYSITGDVSQHVFFMMHGTGRNGKGALIRAVSYALGSDYFTTLNPEELLAQKHARHATAIAALAGSRFVACQETDRGRNLNEAQVKTLTGGDRLKARFMREDEFEFDPTFKIWLATNHKPVIDGEGAQGNLWERLRLIPFLREFKPNEKETGLDAKLAAEAEGILAFLVEGARQAATGKEPVIPECVRVATEGYQKESDLLGEFMDEVTQPATGATCLKSDLHDAYCRWAGVTVDPRNFNKRIGARGIAEKRNNAGMAWVNVAIRPEYVKKSWPV